MQTEAAKMDKLLKEQQWVNFKRRQAAGFEEGCAGWRNRNEVGQDWRRGGAGGRGRGESGFDITGLMGGSGGSSGGHFKHP